ncbi:DUF732 domain-containing protein [Glutamicibacter arilaitensis]|uniref:DUF732 domain-containing protein n=1 Tax=Glutamicibacter arilaitensis TaxID=256701 RepID=UPI003A902A32
MRPKFVALFAVSAVTLVGCSAGEAANEQESNAPSASPKVEAAPLTMSEEQATVEESAEATPESSETDFITFMQPDFSGWKGEFPADDELLAAGYLACEKLDSGVPDMEVEVIPGSLEDPTSALYENNRTLVTAAVSALCKEHILD